MAWLLNATRFIKRAGIRIVSIQYRFEGFNIKQQVGLEGGAFFKPKWQLCNINRAAAIKELLH